MLARFRDHSHEMSAAPPDTPPVLNAFTIDVEDYFHVYGFADVIPRASWEGLTSRVEANTERILERLAARRAFGTFFVLGWVARRHPGLVRRIAAAGHEIASHGMDHALVYHQTPEVFRRETRDSKALLEDVLQAPVLGYRASTYSIIPRSLWALDILAEEGFAYDSSIFPIRHDRYGIPHSPRWPYRIRCAGGRSLVEFPLSTYKVLGYHLPVSGGGYFRIFPYGLTSFALSRVNAYHRPFIFYLHPWEIDPEQPRVEGAGRVQTWRHRFNLDRCEDRLVRLLDRFPFGTVRDVLARHEPDVSLDLAELKTAPRP
jgi:polysaccharide deacetylase family protein (PEP-CTERM system associated)